jgi:splicing factor 3A subunit 3
VNGKYLDLHEHFAAYSNLLAKEKEKARAKQQQGNGEQTDGVTQDGGAEDKDGAPGAGKKADNDTFDYLDYLSAFRNFAAVPKAIKQSGGYLKYLEDLYQYMHSFHERTSPLESTEKIVEAGMAKFAEQWKEGKVPGWERGTGSGAFEKHCEPCDHLFTNSATYEAHLKGKKHLKAVEKFNAGGASGGAAAGVGAKAPGSHGESGDRNQRVAGYEAKICALADSLEEAVVSTKGFVEVKQTRTAEELEKETNELEAAAADVRDKGDSDNEDEKPIYNPLNLPMDALGKPIPYWLWKLHGLGQEFKCEICGNQTYIPMLALLLLV